MPKTLIAGAGISGLALGVFLKSKGYDDFLIIEPEDRVGGKLHTHIENNRVFELGANTVMMEAALSELIDCLDLQDEVLYPSPKAAKRYILRNNTLHGLEPHPKTIFKTKLLSLKGKLRLLKEPFVGKGNDEKESVADFFERRLGKEVVDYLINPMIAGIYAGAPKDLEMQSVFPKLVEMEQSHGSLFSGMRAAKKKKSSAPKRQIFSFKRGFSSLTEAASVFLKDHIHTGEILQEIQHESEGFKVKTCTHEYAPENLILATPAYVNAQLLKNINPEFEAILNTIPYSKVLAIQVLYPEGTAGQALDGFGFLVPEKEKLHLLGAIWNSALFERNGQEGEQFCLFVGGSRQAHFFEKYSEQEIVAAALADFEAMMRINQKPIKTMVKLWERGIPQYQIGHKNNIDKLIAIEKSFPGLHLIGNYKSGVAVGKCVEQALHLAKKLNS